MSDDGDRTCPLCAEEMDITDQQLKPCKCGYEVLLSLPQTGLAPACLCSNKPAPCFSSLCVVYVCDSADLCLVLAPHH